MADRFCALDTDVLLSLQAGEKICVEAHRLLRKGDFIFRASPTVTQELERHRERTDTYIAALSENILSDPKRLDVVLDGFDDTQRKVTDIHVNRLIERKLADEKQKGDLFALIEAAYLDCVLFVTTRETVLSNRASLTLALIQDCGMNRVFICSPHEIVSAFNEEPAS